MIEESSEKRQKEDLNEMSEVILNILDYYSFKQKIEDEGDKWKEGTKYENEDLIPNDIDEKVKELFLIKLKNLINSEKEILKKK